MLRVMFILIIDEVSKNDHFWGCTISANERESFAKFFIGCDGLLSIALVLFTFFQWVMIVSILFWSISSTSFLKSREKTCQEHKAFIAYLN